MKHQYTGYKVNKFNVNKGRDYYDVSMEIQLEGEVHSLVNIREHIKEDLSNKTQEEIISLFEEQVNMNLYTYAMSTAYNNYIKKRTEDSFEIFQLAKDFTSWTSLSLLEKELSSVLNKKIKVNHLSTSEELRITDLGSQTVYYATPIEIREVYIQESLNPIKFNILYEAE